MSGRYSPLAGDRFLSAVPTTPKRAARIARHVLCVGFDSEWDTQTGHLISVQFAVKVPGGELRSAVVYPGVARLGVSSLLQHLKEFLQDNQVLPPLHRRQRRVALIAHFAGAELSMLDDALGELKIKQVGKAHHARFPDLIDTDGVKWQVRLVDLYAFYKASLAAIGLLVNLPKFDEDRINLSELLRQDRQRFERYAARDAEIAVTAFGSLRETVLSEWQIDVLTKPSLPSVAADIYRRHFMKLPPVSVKTVPMATLRKTARGWSQRLVKCSLFNGSRAVREVALQSLAGGRVEACVRGLVEHPVAEFDVVSLYPHAAILQPLPHAGTRWLVVKDVSALETLEGVGRFSFKFPKNTPHPCLLVKSPLVNRAMFPLQGETNCTFAEIREALRMGAAVKVIEAWGFLPDASEREHDLANYMRHWIAVKAAAQRKSLAYENAKLFLNALIGKFAERHRDNSILELERVARAEGHPGIASIVARSGALRDNLFGDEDVGGLWLPEWASLILGKARALMAGIVAQGALLVSTDSVIVRTPLAFDVPGLAELRSVRSDLLEEAAGDAVFIARSRLYAVLRRPDRIPPNTRVYARDEAWAVVRVARHATPESEQQFAETVLRCLAAGKDVAPERERTRLLTAQGAARTGGAINQEVPQRGKTRFTWDHKRRLSDRDVNIFTSFSSTRPYLTVGKLIAAELAAKVRRGEARKRRRERAPEVMSQLIELIDQGLGAREIERRTGVPRSTVSDLRQRLKAPTTPDIARAAPASGSACASVPGKGREKIPQ